MSRVFAFLPVIGWLAVACVGVWLFVGTLSLAETSSDGSTRTWADKAFPVLFLLLVPLGLWFARREYRRAEAERPFAEAEAARNSERRERQAAAQQRLRDGFPLEETQRATLIASLSSLRGAGVIAPGEVDDTEFTDLAERIGVEDGGLQEASALLGEYQIEQGIRYANLAVFHDQVEVFDDDIAAMAGAFARIAGRSGDMTEIRVEMLPDDPGRRRLRYRLDGEPGALDFEFHAKYVSNSLMMALSELFDPDPPFAVASFDGVLLVTRLSDAEMAEFNAARKDDWAHFARIE